MELSSPTDWKLCVETRETTIAPRNPITTIRKTAAMIDPRAPPSPRGR